MLKSLEPGKYYFVVDCAKCCELIPFAEAPTPEDDPEPTYRTITDLRCPTCEHSDIYAPALMKRLLAEKNS